MVELYFSLGANLGDRSKNILTALDLLDKGLGRHYTALSALVETEPWGFEAEEKFLNAAVRYDVEDCGEDTEAFGLRVLDLCKGIERKIGRTGGPEWDGEGRRIYESRLIDIDILFIGGEIVECDRLSVPHRQIAKRDFVLVPLKEIASANIRTAFPDIFCGK